MIHPKKVGHVVLKARNIAQVEQFYTEVMGFEVVTRLKRPRGVFFSLVLLCQSWSLGEQY